MPVFEVKLIRFLEGKKITREYNNNEWQIESELTILLYSKRQRNIITFSDVFFPDFQQIEITKLAKPKVMIMESLPEMEKYGVKIAKETTL